MIPDEVHNKLPPETASYLKGSSVLQDGGGLANRISYVAKTRLREVPKPAGSDSSPPVKDHATRLEPSGYDEYYLAAASEDDLKDFEAMMGDTTNSRGALQPGPMAMLMRLYPVKRESVELPNGETLSAAEQSAIYAYTTESYLLVNGTLDGDQTSINMWHKQYTLGDLEHNYRLTVMTAQDEFQLALAGGNADAIQAAKDYRQAVISQFEAVRGYKDDASAYNDDLEYFATSVAYMAASGLNKLPKYEGQLFRGDAISLEKLKAWRENPPTEVTHKFFSCSTSISMCEDFAKSSAEEYMADRQEPYIPVLHVFQSQSSRDIMNYSAQPSEEERVFLPGTALQQVGLDETSVPGLVIAFWKERT